MARNKNSTALFDVIHAAKKPPKSSPSANIPAPRWWGKDKKPLRPTDASENVGKQRSWLSAAKQNVSAAGSVAPVDVAASSAAEISIETNKPHEQVSSPETAAEVIENGSTVESESVKTAPPKARFMDRFKNRSMQQNDVIVEPVSAVNPLYTEGDSESLAVSTPPLINQTPEATTKLQSLPARESREAVFAVNRTTRDIHLNLSYGGIVAIALIMLMALAAAFIAGSRTQIAALTPDVSDDRGAVPVVPPNAGMMAAVSPNKSTDPVNPVKSDVLEVSPKTPRAKPENPTPSSTPLRISATRDIGMIYVVIQSYPDQELAQKACDFMNHAGVSCTLVQGLNGWAPRDWYSVVGLQPFKKHDPGLAEYEKAATSLGVKFSPKILNQFQPQGYTWRTDSEANAE